MKNKSTSLMLTTLILAIAGSGMAAAATGDQNPGIPGQVQRNAADIADNFSLIQDNRADIRDLEERVSDLESGGGAPGGERTFVEVDCTVDGDANALLTDGGASIYFPPNTTYNIHGACNGPLYVTEDGVRFVGVLDTFPKIVLPAEAERPEDGTVFVDGASNVRIQDLEIDASAFATKDAEGTDAAGIYARDSYLRIRNVRVVGGLWSINPFRNAVLRLDGTVVLENFVSAGLSVGDNSLVRANGPVEIKTIVDSTYMAGVEVYRSSVVDLRGGVKIDLTDQENRNSITSSNHSLVIVRDRGEITIDGGEVSVGSQSSLRIDGGELRGDIFVSRVSSLTLNNVAQLEGIINAQENSSLSLDNTTQSAGEIRLEMNSNATLGFSHVGSLSAFGNSSFRGFGGSFNGINLDQGAIATFNDTDITALSVLLSSTFLEIFGGNMNANPVFICGELVHVFVNPASNPGGQISGCPPFP